MLDFYKAGKDYMISVNLPIEYRISFKFVGKAFDTLERLKI